jgi:hypothetical protein
VSPDGTLYAIDNTAAEGMKRSLNPTGSTVTAVLYPYFEEVRGASTGPLTGTMDKLLMESGPKLWTIYNGTGIKYYEDTLTGSPTLVSPADGAESVTLTGIVLSWNAMDGAKTYQVLVNSDPSFLGVGVTVPDTSLTSTGVSGLASGTDYYWKVRVLSQSPTRSRWSETRMFSTALGAAPWSPFVPASGVSPAPGATDVPLSPVFQWNPAEWATGYDFDLSDSPDFSTIVSTTVSEPFYAYDGVLDYSTSYYWRVRAVSATSESGWGEGVFTTMAAPPPPPPEPPEPEPPVVIPPVEQVTPAYIWAIIAIGAVLVIAVIVLIVRTRRPI